VSGAPVCLVIMVIVRRLIDASHLFAAATSAGDKVPAALLSLSMFNM